jgi:PKD repeat protein
VEITVNNVSPTARARASKSSVDEDTAVVFNATETSDSPSDMPILSFQWDFGDGRTDGGAVVEHAFTKQKSYKVLLTVTDDEGAQSTAELTVKVSNVVPVITASSDRIRAPAGVAINFSAIARDTESDLPTLQFEWELGDMATGKGQNVSHAYISAGRYTVTARVTDDEGATDVQKLNIEVYTPEQPPAPASSGPPTIIYAVAGTLAVVAVIATAALLWRRGKRPEDRA